MEWSGYVKNHMYNITTTDSQMHATTIMAVRKDGSVAIGSDGQVTLGHTVVKHSANKIRRIDGSDVLVGFAGSTSDALALFDKFSEQIQKYQGDLNRAAVELGKLWRTDRILRRLEAMMIVCNAEQMLMLSGSGDVIQPEEQVLAIGSGGAYAYAAGLALKRNTDLDAREIVRQGLCIASKICIYTNDHITIESLDGESLDGESLDSKSLDSIQEKEQSD